MAIGRSGVVIQVENYIVSGACGRDVDTDLLAEYGEAGVDIGFKPAKYRVARPAATGRRDEADTVNVYPSGKVVCLGAKSVERARTDVRMVLRRLGVPTEGTGAGDAEGAAAVRYVVMSGCIFGGHDVHRAIPRLRERYEVTLDSEVFSGYFVRTKGADGDKDEGGVSVQVFAPDAGMAREGGRTPLLCRGPTVREVSRVVGDVYRTIVEADSKPDGDDAETADSVDDVHQPSV